MTDTTIVALPDSPDDGTTGPADPAPQACKRLRKRGRITKWMAIIWLVALTVTAIGASWVPWVTSDCSDFEDRTQCSTHVIGSLLKSERPPVWAFWADSPRPVLPGSPERYGLMGTDTSGRDLFSRAMFGARNSLLIGLASILTGLFIGGLLGLAAGYRGKRTDKVIDTVMNVMLAFPALLLAIFVVGFFNDFSPTKASQRSIWPIILALSILAIPPLTRLVRANTILYAQREFVLAARSLGASNRRIVFREILPNVVPAMITFALTGMALLIIAEGALAYLGLSVNEPNPTWGAMIVAGENRLEVAWWISMMPAFVMFLTILSINLLGDVLAERFRIRESIG